jgi:hypothetical protein
MERALCHRQGTASSKKSRRFSCHRGGVERQTLAAEYIQQLLQGRGPHVSIPDTNGQRPVGCVSDRVEIMFHGGGVPRKLDVEIVRDRDRSS